MKDVIKIGIAIYVQPDDNGFHAFCPSLKGLHVPGDTEIEALNNAKNAALAYLNSIVKHGDPIPLQVISNPEEFCLQGLKPNKYEEIVSVPACA